MIVSRRADHGQLIMKNAIVIMGAASAQPTPLIEMLLVYGHQLMELANTQ